MTVWRKSSGPFLHLREADILWAHMFFPSDSKTIFSCVLIQMFKLHITDNVCFIRSTSQYDCISIRENEEASVSDTTSLKRKYFPRRQKSLPKYSPKWKSISTKNFYISFLFHELTWVCGIYISYKIFTHFPFSAGERKSSFKRHFFCHFGGWLGMRVLSI